MTDLIVAQNNLPASIEDLSKFVMFGEEKIKVVRAAMCALDKLKFPKAVYELKLREAQEITEQVALAKIELGKRFNDLPKAGNGGANQYQAKSTSQSSKQKSEVIAELGFTQKQAERFQQMAKNPDVVQAAMIKARENGDVVSQAQILNEIKQTKRKQEIQKQAEAIEQQAIEQPDGLFNVIVIDPPWGYVKQAHHGSYDATGRRCTCPYPEMTQDELKTIELPAAEDCVLFLWTTHKFIWDAKELLDHWHFDYRCLLVWDKQQLGLGNLIRMQCEFCLVGLKGTAFQGRARHKRLN